jgi:hypothetical protein
MNAAGIMKIIELALGIGSSVIEAIRNRDDAEEIKLKDLPGWNKWKTEVFSPDYDAVAEELKKRREKLGGE